MHCWMKRDLMNPLDADAAWVAEITRVAPLYMSAILLASYSHSI